MGRVMEWPLKEGETPLDDLSGLKLRIVNPTRDQVEEFEARNIAFAYEKYFIRKVTARSAPFDVPWAKKLHSQMLGDVWGWAGEFRKTDKSIGVPKEQVYMQMLQLFDDLKAWPTIGMSWVEQAARLHHRAVQIHPFENGNGRWARLLADIWLRLNGQNYIEWPSNVQKESPIRKEYLLALREADNMNYKPLLDLFLRYHK